MVQLKKKKKKSTVQFCFSYVHTYLVLYLLFTTNNRIYLTIYIFKSGYLTLETVVTQPAVHPGRPGYTEPFHKPTCPTVQSHLPANQGS